MDKLKRALSGDSYENQSVDEESGIASQFRDATTLGWTSRIKGFAICFGLGFIFSMLGVFFLAIPVKGIKLFAIFYSLGNILSISSTCFLMGPWKQLKKMFHPTRVIATIVALTFLVLTLVVAIKYGKTGRTLVCCLVQFLAMTWYSLSYIPYARDAVLKLVNF
uniref:Vesicle transport protein n=1 Tax=Aceria tosichella TaxID=561515 RepID=A0A6G1S790_9ACAR